MGFQVLGNHHRNIILFHLLYCNYPDLSIRTFAKVKVVPTLPQTVRGTHCGSVPKVAVYIMATFRGE